ncbi:hypothetical protein [Mucilaginibacter sp. FT3.2]|uniref:hypothetical protein n=1 Tax=Mucilaginibacter sp. FT3.2 TaxID=2723090 RepID=UPI00160C0026|nr:hypothetical protein [Mucilaginibacter sp. FT3.2]MBB6231998.1 hypothetical protein [Mucilaginibacter sp. FT3.2]
MKKQLLALVACIFSVSPLFAQKVELSVQATSGLFNFAGKSSTGTSQVIQSSSDNNTNYTNNPYGNHSGFSYGGSIQAQVVAKSGFIFGLQGGYEILRSQVTINKYTPLVYYYGLQNQLAYTDPSFPVKGHTNLQNQTINLNPYIGYRMQLHKVKLDILPGMDIGIMLNTKDKGSVKGNDGKTYTVDYARPKPPTDVRLRLGAIATYGRIGLNASYAYGLTNYQSAIPLDTNAGGGNSTPLSVHSELLRVGLSYRIN